MCVSFIWFRPASGAGKAYELVIAANRDDIFDGRVSYQPASWQRYGSRSSFGPNCTRSNGTRFAIDAGGRFIIVMDIKCDLNNGTSTTVPRASLGSGFISSNLSAEQFARLAVETGEDYKGFNLICGDGERVNASLLSATVPSPYN
jgi:uncharacterized protein with NRDE domain